MARLKNLPTHVSPKTTPSLSSSGECSTSSECSSSRDSSPDRSPVRQHLSPVRRPSPDRTVLKSPERPIKRKHREVVDDETPVGVRKRGRKRFGMPQIKAATPTKRSPEELPGRSPVRSEPVKKEKEPPAPVKKTKESPAPVKKAKESPVKKPSLDPPKCKKPSPTASPIRDARSRSPIRSPPEGARAFHRRPPPQRPEQPRAPFVPKRRYDYRAASVKRAARPVYQPPARPRAWNPGYQQQDSPPHPMKKLFKHTHGLAVLTVRGNGYTLSDGHYSFSTDSSPDWMNELIKDSRTINFGTLYVTDTESKESWNRVRNLIPHSISQRYVKATLCGVQPIGVCPFCRQVNCHRFVCVAAGLEPIFHNTVTFIQH